MQRLLWREIHKIKIISSSLTSPSIKGGEIKSGHHQVGESSKQVPSPLVGEGEGEGDFGINL